MTRYWCARAWTGAVLVDGVVIEVDGERITGMGRSPEPPAGAVRLDGVTLPGFANAHSHAFHRALRGRTHDGPGTFWTWRDQMYALAERLDPDRYHRLARAVFAEMVLAGFTCVGEFHYLHHGPGGVPYGDPNEMGQAVLDAASAAGIRITLLDTCYLRSGPGPDGSVLGSVQRRFSDGDADAWAERASALRGGPTVRVGAALHSVRAVDPASMVIVAAFARERSTVVHAHVSEQPAENEACEAAHGSSPVALLERHGVLGPAFTAVHATHVEPLDIRRLAASGSSVCLCPTTERDLADGIGPSGALAAAGVPLCTGTDSHAVVDPFEELRAVEHGERLATLRRGTHDPPGLLTAGTEAGHRALGWPDGGRIEVGALADFVTLSTTSVRLAGTGTGLAPLVHAATAADVQHVVVAGEDRVVGGRHLRMDVSDELARAVTEVWA